LIVVSEEWRDAAAGLAWVVAIVWMVKTKELVTRLHEVPDLTAGEWVWPEGMPSLAVIVAARDEEPNLRATLEALAVQEYSRLRVVVVDDRSTDGTGAIADEFARKLPERFEAVHIHELPEGWLGKTWALEVGTERCRGEDVLLFTDADVLLSPSVLWRALRYMEMMQAEHVVVFPTPVVKARGEGILLGFFQLMGVWVMRPWRVSDPKSKRDAVGVGAFNMVRRAAWEELGGWLPQRMVVLEDVTVGRRIKAAGMRQVVAFAPERVLVHWAAGMRGMVRVMTKNLFSGVNFRPLLMLGLCAWIAVFMLLPAAGLLWVGTLVPCALVMLCVAASYRELGAVSGIDARYGWAYPVGALVMVWAMLRSMAVVLWQRGVVWRGTHYSLRELKRENSPFRWGREAAEMRARLRQGKASRLRRWVDRWKG
jgi:glycosyltransferase involved in cell wall biosynthesis